MAQPSRSPPYAGSLAAILVMVCAPPAAAQSRGAPAYPSSPYPGSPSSYPAPATAPLQTGGLTPPPSSPAAASGAENATNRQLNRAEREDAGRGLEFVWLAAESGYEYLSLDNLHAHALVDGSVIGDGGSALLLGAGAGVRLIFLTFGARLHLARQSSWDLWTLNAEVGLHLPYGALEPSFTLSAGYAWLGSPDAKAAPAGFAADRIDISGFDTRLGAALDWYLNPLLSLGIQSSVELLVLSRSGAAQPALADSASGALGEQYGKDGNGIGLGLSATAALGLHF